MCVYIDGFHKFVYIKDRGDVCARIYVCVCAYMFYGACLRTFIYLGVFVCVRVCLYASASKCVTER
jgi:hypothetical protein